MTQLVQCLSWLWMAVDTQCEHAHTRAPNNGGLICRVSQLPNCLNCHLCVYCRAKVVISPHIYPPTITHATTGFSGAALYNRLSVAHGYLSKQVTIHCSFDFVAAFRSPLVLPRPPVRCARPLLQAGDAQSRPIRSWCAHPSTSVLRHQMTAPSCSAQTSDACTDLWCKSLMGDPL